MTQLKRPTINHDEYKNGYVDHKKRQDENQEGEKEDQKQYNPKCLGQFNRVPSFHTSPDLMNYERKYLKEHPVGFAIIAHKDITILETFFAMYFRPWDFYVIHLDKKVKRLEMHLWMYWR